MTHTQELRNAVYSIVKANDFFGFNNILQAMEATLNDDFFVSQLATELTEVELNTINAWRKTFNSFAGLTV